MDTEKETQAEAYTRWKREAQERNSKLTADSELPNDNGKFCFCFAECEMCAIVWILRYERKEAEAQ